MTSTSGRPPGFRRGKRISDLMTPDLHAFVESSLAAERAGDAVNALEYHQGVPMFLRGAHRVQLQQLAGLADEMPPWLWARWIAYQCTRAEDAGTELRDIVRVATRYSLDMFEPDLMDQAYDEGADPVKVLAHTMGESWAYHQLCTFELGGLEQFLDTMVVDRLAAHAGLARQWVDAPMGGYQVDSAGRDGLIVLDAADGRPVALLDLGAAVHAGPGRWLLGRVVPSGTEPGLMFDARPLPVDEGTARACARDRSRGAWITALARAFAEGRVDRSVLRSEDRELVTDVPSLMLVEHGTAPSALAATLDQLGRGRDEVGRAAFRILRAAAAGPGGAEEASYVAAAVVNPHAWIEAQQQLVQPRHQAAWEGWAGQVPEPARGRLALLARLSRAAAA